MLQNIDIIKLLELKESDPAFTEIVDELLLNHQKTLRTISHELRNPLAFISSSLQLIESDHPEVHTYKYWETTRIEIDHMKNMLERLTTVSTSPINKIKQIDMHELIRHLINVFSSITINTSIDFTYFLPKYTPFVLGNRDQLQEVFANLFRNAMEALHTKGHIHLHIYEEALDDVNYFVAALSNNGPHIPEERLESIFEEFTTYKLHGTGIGLSLCQSILTEHNGHISVESLKGGNTTFYVRLPAHYH